MSMRGFLCFICAFFSIFVFFSPAVVLGALVSVDESVTPILEFVHVNSTTAGITTCPGGVPVTTTSP